MINECKNESEFKALLVKSKDKPQMLLKHSTQCGLSKMAMAEFRRLATTIGHADLSVVLVFESRPLSASIAEQTGVDHDSPQVILISDGTAVWHASHGAIELDSMKEAIQLALK